MIDYTLVVGVDYRHLNQLAMVWPTWKKSKPSLLLHPMVVFFDKDQVRSADVFRIVDHPWLTVVSWPFNNNTYAGDAATKWYHPQRYKMLAGFVYVPDYCIETPYFLKVDTDVVATGQDDWVDPAWFADSPAIVSHPWGFTRPANLMLHLDRWVDDHRDVLPQLFGTNPLSLVPKPGFDRVCHPRITSWCSFFNTEFNQTCARMAEDTMGNGQLPVPSQDSFLFYCATRMGLGVVRPRMKLRGWSQWLTTGNITKHCQEVMQNVCQPLVT